MRSSSGIVILLCSSAFSYWAWQQDWSSGPGYPGPSHYWTTAFDSEANINWSGTEGLIYLDITSSRHNIGGGVPGNRFVYPGDINGDGAVDVVTSSLLDHTHVWFENDGTGLNWTEHLIYSSGIQCYSAYPVDIDGDNDLDVVGSTSEGSADSIFWFENLDGIGVDWGVHLIDTSLPEPCLLVGAEIDGDDDIDLFVGSTSDPTTVVWYENLDGFGTGWQQHDVFTNPGGFFVNEIFSTDLDQDDDQDLLVAYLNYGGLVFCENESNGSIWSVHGFDTDPEYEVPYSVGAGDLDGDGDQDVAVADGNPPNWGRVYWFENLDGSCENWEQHILADSLPGVNSVHVADLTDDGYLDILVGSGCGWGEQLVLFWENIGGTGEYFARRDIDSGYDCLDVSSADIDNDGVEDAITNNVLSSVFWLESESCTSGELVSSIRDMWGDPDWEQVYWDAVEAPDAQFSLQVRGSDDPENMGEWSENIYEPGDLSPYLDSSSRYIQYKAVMETSGRFGTPILDVVAFHFASLGAEEGSTRETMFRISPNPCYGTAAISFSVAEPGMVEFTIYDLAGREAFSLADEMPAGSSSLTVPCLTTGTYFARFRYEEENQLARFIFFSE